MRGASVFERILRATRAIPWNLSVVNRISIDIHQARFLVGPVLKLGFLWFFPKGAIIARCQRGNGLCG